MVGIRTGNTRSMAKPGVSHTKLFIFSVLLRQEVNNRPLNRDIGYRGFENCVG
jgi:hypothetical protein